MARFLTPLIPSLSAQPTKISEPSQLKWSCRVTCHFFSLYRYLELFVEASRQAVMAIALPSMLEPQSLDLAAGKRMALIAVACRTLTSVFGMTMEIWQQGMSQYRIIFLSRVFTTTTNYTNKSWITHSGEFWSSCQDCNLGYLPSSLDLYLTCDCKNEKGVLNNAAKIDLGDFFRPTRHRWRSYWMKTDLQ